MPANEPIAHREAGELPVLFIGTASKFRQTPIDEIIRSHDVRDGPILEGTHRQTAQKTARNLKAQVQAALRQIGKKADAIRVIWPHAGAGEYQGLQLEKDPQGIITITRAPAHYPVQYEPSEKLNEEQNRAKLLDKVKRVVAQGFDGGPKNAVFTIHARAMKERFANSPKGDRFFVQTTGPLKTILWNGTGYPHKTEPHDIVGVTVILEQGISEEKRRERMSRYREALSGALNAGRRLHFI